MKFEYIILLVILFNVVTAYLQKRAKAEKAKRQAEAAAAKSLKPSPPVPKTVGAEITRKTPEPEWELEVEEEDEEHSHSDRWHQEEEGEEHPAHRSRQPSRPATVPVPERPTGGSGNSREKAATLGKGLLEQLAKELGLRLPESKAEPEIPEPAPARHAPVHHPEPAHPVAGSTRGMAVPFTPTSVAAGRPGKHSSPLGLDMKKMREAVILREILDKPVSLRAGRFN